MSIKKSSYIPLLGVAAKFVNVFEPVSKFGSKPKYGAQFLISNNDPQLLKLQEAVDTLAAEAFPGVKKVASPLRDGNTQKDTEKYPEYKNSVFVEASTQFPPEVLDSDKSKLSPDDDPFADGVIVNGIIHFVSYDLGPKKGVTAVLDSIQFWERGKKLRSQIAMPELPCRSTEVCSVTENSSTENTGSDELLGW